MSDFTQTYDLENEIYFYTKYELCVKNAAKKIQKSIDQHLGQTPEFAITLGSGLSKLTQAIEVHDTIEYSDIPYFPVSTVKGHEGKLIVGKIEGVPIIGLSGRKHYYEVADEPFNNGMKKVVFPVHVMAELGIKNYFATNAAGGLNLNYNVGDLMIIEDQINLIPNPLLGKHYLFKTLDGEYVARFQPMNGAYDYYLKSMLYEAGLKRDDFFGKIHQGKYLAVIGPSYETSAECVAFRDSLFADAVGMSTAPEVIVARNRGMKCVGFSCITNKIFQNGNNATTHEEVQAVLNSDEVKNRALETVQGFFKIYKQKQYVEKKIV